MRQSQTTSNDDYLSENRVELEGKKEVCSTACGEPERRCNRQVVLNTFC
ncbi:hypothetical protein ACFP7A_07290 [Sporolactobacillus kofuensis]|uniref:Lantibiotic n=1 Tax=Sporolactobacillus kofuensis TaxID=269672 RepID=A0ABW1WE73_9BACL